MIDARTRATLIGLARVLNIAFFLITSVYCLLKYSPFTYEQFIKPNVSGALTDFAVWHGGLYWLVLSVTALTLAPFLEQPRAREIGWSYLAASVGFGAWLTMHPLWLQKGTSPGNLILAIVATLPPICLALFDHAATDLHRRTRKERGEVETAARPELVVATGPSRVWTACWGTAIFACVAYAVAASIRLRLTPGIELSVAGVLVGWTVSAVGHLTAFTLLFLALVAVGSVTAFTRTPGRTEYWLLWAGASAGAALTLLRVMMAPIAIRGAAAWAVSVALGVALASTWSGIARHRLAVKPRGGANAGTAPTALEAWLAPIVLHPSKRLAVGGLLTAAIASQIVIARVATFDWEFMLQKLATLALWLVAFALIHALARERLPRRALWIAPAIVLALFAGEQVLLPRLAALVPRARINAEFALDGYAAVDPSFRIAREILGSGTPGDAAEFYAYLRAHALLQGTALEPVDIDFVHSWSETDPRPPHIFLFIIDSLRPDYLSAYNSGVTFTPAIDAFAADSLVFKRAFSRYAGTGLAVPAIWAGAMLIHKQYVTPFAPTNALEKLLDAKGYQRFITEDHITDELFAPSASTIGLDHHVPEMLHTFCRTMGELGPRLDAYQGEAPLFAMTRPLDLHIGNIASAATPAGESYPGFYAPYAARVKRIDDCFGEFIATLKRTGRYDNSVIVLTSDHGDSLGEAQRWGHGFTAFPEVLRIPLIVHVPKSIRAGMSADLGRVSFSTDITPTLYAAAGESPRVHEEGGGRDLLIGSSLLVEPSADLSRRRRESYLVASSYGPVFGLLGRNGRRLYLADGVESREYAYELRPDGTDVRIALPDAEREASRLAIRRQIAALAEWYRFAP